MNNLDLYCLHGIPIYKREMHFTKKVLIPCRSKKKRIKKKWAKNLKNYKEVEDKNYVLKTPTGIFMHPEMYDKFRNSVL